VALCGLAICVDSCALSVIVPGKFFTGGLTTNFTDSPKRSCNLWNRWQVFADPTGWQDLSGRIRRFTGFSGGNRWQGPLDPAGLPELCPSCL